MLLVKIQHGLCRADCVFSILKENDEVELLDTTDRDGARIYTRGLLFIMSMAFKKLYPEELLNINYQLKSSMLCELQNIFKLPF